LSETTAIAIDCEMVIC